MIEEHRAGAEIHARTGWRVQNLVSRLNMGGGLGESGQLDLGIATLDLVVRDAITFGMGYVVGYARYLRGRLLRRAGRVEEAEAELSRALAEAGDDPRLRAQAHTELARIALVRDDLDEARERADLAVDLASGAPSALPHALAVCADLERRVGNVAAAERASAEAVAMLHDRPGDDPSYVWRVRIEIDPSSTEAARADLRARAQRAGPPELQRAFLALPDNARIVR